MNPIILARELAFSQVVLFLWGNYIVETLTSYDEIRFPLQIVSTKLKIIQAFCMIVFNDKK